MRLSGKLLWVVLQEVSEHSRCYPEGRALTRPLTECSFVKADPSRDPSAPRDLVTCLALPPDSAQRISSSPEEESEKAGLKLNIQKTKIMASGPITSWQIDGEKNGISDRFYFLGLQNN